MGISVCSAAHHGEGTLRVRSRKRSHGPQLSAAGIKCHGDRSAFTKEAWGPCWVWFRLCVYCEKDVVLAATLPRLNRGTFFINGGLEAQIEPIREICGASLRLAMCWNRKNRMGQVRFAMCTSTSIICDPQATELCWMANPQFKGYVRIQSAVGPQGKLGGPRALPGVPPVLKRKGVCPHRTGQTRGLSQLQQASGNHAKSSPVNLTRKPPACTPSPSKNTDRQLVVPAEAYGAGGRRFPGRL